MHKPDLVFSIDEMSSIETALEIFLEQINNGEIESENLKGIKTTTFFLLCKIRKDTLQGLSNDDFNLLSSIARTEADFMEKTYNKNLTNESKSYIRNLCTVEKKIHVYLNKLSV